MSVKQSFTICASISSDQISSMDDDIDSSTEKHKWVATDLLEKKILKEVLPHQYLEDENDEDNEHHFLNDENSMRSESGALTYLYLDGIFSSHFPPLSYFQNVIQIDNNCFVFSYSTLSLL